MQLSIDKFQTNDLDPKYKGDVYRLKQNKIIYGLNSTEIKIINLLNENYSLENLYTIKLKGKFYPVELDNNNHSELKFKERTTKIKPHQVQKD